MDDARGSSDATTHSDAPGWIGRDVPRRDGHDKVTGAALYVDDISLPGMLHGATVRSEVARGRIVAIEYPPEIPWHELVVVTAADIPGPNVVKLIERDQPLLADEVVNHCDEPIVLLAHGDRELLERARRAVRVVIEPLPAVFEIESALAKDVVIWGEDNIFRRYAVDRGDVDTALRDPDLVIVEGTYETGAQEQMYIEPQAMMAEWADGRAYIVGSM